MGVSIDEPWKKYFVARLAEGVAKGDVTKEVQQKYGIGYKTVYNFGYRLKLAEGNVEETAPVDNKKSADKPIEPKINDEARKTLEALNQQSARPLKPPYKAGQRFRAEVIEVRKYGAQMVIQDQYKYEAFLHVKNLVGHYVTDIHQYINVGDIIDVKIKEVSRDNKIELSSKEYFANRKPNDSKPQPAVNPDASQIAQKLGAVKDKIVTQQPVFNEIEKMETESMMKEYLAREMNQAITFLNSIFGMVSPRAQALALGIVRKHGVFRFTMAVSKVAALFENDLGVHFLREVEKEAESFSDVEFIVESHAIDRWCSDRVANGRTCDRKEAERSIIEKCRTGIVVVDLGFHRYYRNGDLVFPCKRGEKANQFSVLTVLTWEMFEGDWQAKVDKYA
jgi:predicted RNA-binding protein with RPS1 domain